MNSGVLISILLTLIFLLDQGYGASVGVATLDASLSPVKKYISQYIGQLNLGQCSPHELSNIEEGFINYSRAYDSGDFQKSLMKGVHITPLMLYVSVLILVVWIFVTLFSCFFRCCFRHVKSCNPVMNASNKKKRKRWEITCIVVYAVALGCFVLATILCITTLLTSLNGVKNMAGTVIPPARYYLNNIQTRYSGLNSYIPSIVPNVINQTINSIELEELYKSVNEYGVKGFGFLGKFVQDTIKLVNDHKPDLVTHGNDVLSVYNGDPNAIKQYGSDIIKKYQEIDAVTNALSGIYITNIINNAIDDILKELPIPASISISDLTISTSGILDMNTLGAGISSCFTDHSANFINCLGSKIKNSFDSNALSNNLSSALSSWVNGKIPALPTSFGSTIGDITNYLDGIENVLLYNDLTPIITLMGISGSDMETMVRKYYPYVLPAICALIIIPMLIFIIPMIVSLALIKRNKKKGKCQCRGCIKCATCCFSCGTPIIMIIITAIGFGLSLFYVTAMIILFNTDHGNFDQINGKKPAIGKTFSDCGFGGYLEKKNIATMISNSFDDNSGNFINKIITGMIYQTSYQVLNNLYDVFSCDKLNDVNVNISSIPYVASYDDRDYIKNSGDFIHNLHIGDILKSFIEDTITENNLATELIKLLDPPASNSQHCMQDPLVCLIESYIGVNGDIDIIYELKDKMELYVYGPLNMIPSDNIDFRDEIPEYIKISYDGPPTVGGSPNSDYEDSKKLKCDGNTLINDVHNVLNGVATNSLSSQDVIDDINKIDLCYGANKPEEIVLDNTILEILNKIINEIPCSGPSDCPEIFNLKDDLQSIYNILDNTSDDLIPWLNKADHLRDGMTNAKVVYNNDFVNRDIEIQDNMTGGIADSINDTMSSLVLKLDLVKASDFNGLLSCYPVGAVGSGLYGATKNASGTWTQFTMALLFLAVGCLIMIIASNLGPMVYHKKYKVGKCCSCCCCCKKKKEDDKKGKKGKKDKKDKGDKGNVEGKENSTSSSNSSNTENKSSDERELECNNTETEIIQYAESPILDFPDLGSQQMDDQGIYSTPANNSNYVLFFASQSAGTDNPMTIYQTSDTKSVDVNLDPYA